MAFPVRFNADMDYLRRNNRSVGLEEIEKFYESKRSDYGLTHALALFLHVIDVVHKPLEEWMELNRRNKGGSPTKAIRRFLIEKLAEAAPLIIGKPAPIAISGDFVSLCAQVLPVCGLSAEGVGKAVPAIVRRIRAKTGERSESNGDSM